MSPQTARRLRTRPEAESFVRAWGAALDEGRVRAAERALALARAGDYIPLFRAGRQVGVRHRLNNRLLFAACYGEPMSRYEREP